MSKDKKTERKDDLSFLDKLDDQYQEILDNIEANESTDSETTDLINFRVINTNNSYPNKNAKDSDGTNQNLK